MILSSVMDYLRNDLSGQVKSLIGITIVLSIICIIIGHFIKKVDPTKKTPLWLVPLIFIVVTLLVIAGLIYFVLKGTSF